MVRVYETVINVCAIVLDLLALIASSIAFQAHAEAREPPYDILEHNRRANRTVKMELACLAGLLVSLVAGRSYLCLLAVIPPALVHLRRWKKGILFFTNVHTAMRLKREDKIDAAKTVLYTVLFIVLMGQLALNVIH